MYWVDSIPIIISGNNIGNESIGNNADFELAFAIKADIIVVAALIPMLPSNITSRNSLNNSTLMLSININNKSTAKKFKPILRIVLKINFPKNTDADDELILSSNDVPRSSSLTNDLARPVIEPKNIIIHNIPADIFGVSFSEELLNTTIDTVVSINSNTADTEYRVRNSEAISFLAMAIDWLNISIKTVRLCLI